MWPKEFSQTFLKDLLAGLTVSFAAVSLGAAFGVMSGRGALAGMIGAAIIPIITSLLGGTRMQVSGPTGPMTAITALLVAKAHDAFPDSALAAQFVTLSIVMSGLIMIVLGALRTGYLIRFVPNTVVLGFMNGIAVLIWYDQIVKLFGLRGKAPLGGGIGPNIALAGVALIFIYLLPLLFRKFGIPPKVRLLLSPVLLSIIFTSALAAAFHLPNQRVELGASIHPFSQFLSYLHDAIPGSEVLTITALKLALPLALQLAILGYLDSLLTSLVIDRMTGEKTRRNKELVAQGIGNSASGLLMGLPGAQATIRSVLLIKEGAKTRLAGVLAGLFVALFVIALSNLIALIPAAVFVAVLIKSGWDVCDRIYTYVYLKRRWWRSFNRNFQMVIILMTTVLTVIVNLNMAVAVGIVLFYAGRYILQGKNIRDVEDDLEQSID